MASTDSAIRTAILGEYLEAASESASLDFKEACPWDMKTFAKDFMAMANLEHGGRIIIGVEDGTLIRRGVAPEICATYDFDLMKDQFASVADPEIRFRVEVLADESSKQFVVISIESFADVPVICKTDRYGLQAGTIYYRTNSGRPQSARVCSSYDMQSIIMCAVARMHRRLGRLGLAIQTNELSASQQFDAELGDL